MRGRYGITLNRKQAKRRSEGMKETVLKKFAEIYGSAEGVNVYFARAGEYDR